MMGLVPVLQHYPFHNAPGKLTNLRPVKLLKRLKILGLKVPTFDGNTRPNDQNEISLKITGMFHASRKKSSIIVIDGTRYCQKEKLYRCEHYFKKTPRTLPPNINTTLHISVAFCIKN
ncbi:unnamed protein product [Bursaphelenchus okinawaensis]|uniref:Uncharacterized protein n=1 Tax=Bursaphelenchus okinawaensis TaxID=465554 RepID=A0A811KQZ0_9BILA|nr:unnamed protein product [Bursaphelenchus okinawaensis]CAG9108326.1 unnamed protein product [Bursaphelenchus okinawaensis]